MLTNLENQTMMRSLTFVAAFALAAPLHAQAVHIVDPAGGAGVFTNIQPAVDAASSGDLILVRSGNYFGFAVDHKSLTIAAEPGSTPVVTKGSPDVCSVRNLAADQSVELIGLRIERGGGQTFQPAPRLLLEDNLGPVLVQDCAVVQTLLANVSGLRVVDSQHVTVVRSLLDVRGAQASLTFPTAVATGVPLESLFSSVFLYDCHLLAGTGANAPRGFLPNEPGSAGGNAVLQFGGRVVAVGCTLDAGNGGAGSVIPNGACGNGGAGGDAVSMSPGPDGDPSLVLVDTALNPGVGGRAAVPSNCVDGAAGMPIFTFAGANIETPSVSARLMTAEGVVGDMQTMTLTLSGEPFDFVMLALSLTPSDPVWLPQFTGVFYPGAPFFTVKVGSLGASGAKQLTYFNEDQGAPFVPVYIQAFHFGVEQKVVAANPRMIVLRDE